MVYWALNPFIYVNWKVGEFPLFRLNNTISSASIPLLALWPDHYIIKCIKHACNKSYRTKSHILQHTASQCTAPYRTILHLISLEHTGRFLETVIFLEVRVNNKPAFLLKPLHRTPLHHSAAPDRTTLQHVEWSGHSGSSAAETIMMMFLSKKDGWWKLIFLNMWSNPLRRENIETWGRG